MAKRKFRTFEELGAALGISKPERRVSNTMTCRKCGGTMVRVSDSNVFLCEGIKEDGEPCRNRAFTSVKPREVYYTCAMGDAYGEELGDIRLVTLK